MLKRRRFAAGEKIIGENEIGETAYIIQGGRVEISKEVGAASSCSPAWVPAPRSAR